MLLPISVASGLLRRASRTVFTRARISTTSASAACRKMNGPASLRNCINIVFSFSR